MKREEKAMDTFKNEIEDALDLLRENFPVPQSAVSDLPALPLPSLLEQCRQLIDASEHQSRPTIRSVHQMACTGGTLICRCIASLPGTHLLSEVDPLSLKVSANPFQPDNMIALARFGSRPPGRETIVNMFLAALKVLYENSHRRGQDLILRDHAHSQFSFGPNISERPTLREMLTRDYDLHSLVTVRHPIDSYISLIKNDWIQFTPGTLEDYASRYLVFLDRYAGIDILRYEEFVQNPEQEMQRICEILQLRYDASFIEVFPAIKLSGDSGRKGDIIAPRPRHAVPDALRIEAAESQSYAALCQRLGYETSLT